MPPEVLRFRTFERQRDRSHVRLAVRLYIATLRMTSTVPGVSLHGCLVLLSLLPALADPSPAARKYTERFLDGIHFALKTLLTVDRETYFALLAQLCVAAEAFVPCCDPSGFAQRMTSSCTTATYGVAALAVEPNPPPPALLAELQQRSSESTVINARSRALELFRCSIVAETQFDVVCVAYGISSVLTRLAHEHLPLQLSMEAQSTLVEMACGLLASEVDAAPSGALLSAAQRRLPASGWAPPSLKAEERASTTLTDAALAGTNLTLHEVAGNVLAGAQQERYLLPHVHGALLFFTLLAYWADKGAEELASWEAALMRWLREAAVVSAREAAGHAPTFVSAVLALPGQLEGAFQLLLRWSEVAFRRRGSPDADRNGDAAESNSGDYSTVKDVLEPLLEVVESGVRDLGVQAQQRLLLDARRLGLETRIGFTLSCRIPFDAWPTLPESAASDFSQNVTRSAPLLHRVWGLLPTSVVVAAVQRGVQVAAESLTTGEVHLVQANALVCLGCCRDRSAVDAATPLAERFANAIADTLDVLAHDPQAEPGLLFEALAILFRCAPVSQLDLAVDALRAIQEYLVEHKASVAQVSPLSWYRLWSAVTTKLPIPTTANDVASINVLRRAVTLPGRRATAEELQRFPLTLTAVAEGVRVRLCRWLSMAHPVSCIAALTAANDRSMCAAGSSTTTVADQAARGWAHGLIALLFEAEVALRSAAAFFTGYLKEESGLQRFNAHETEGVTTLLAHLASLNLQLLPAMTVVAEAESAAPTGSGQDSGLEDGTRAISRHQSTVETVDVDEDDSNADDEEKEGRSQRSTSSVKANDKAVADNAATTIGTAAPPSDGVAQLLTSVQIQLSNALVQLYRRCRGAEVEQEQPLATAAQKRPDDNAAETKVGKEADSGVPSASSIPRALADVLQKALCTVIALVPTETAGDDLLLSELPCSTSTTVRGGFASMALHRILTCRQPQTDSDVDGAGTFFDGWRKTHNGTGWLEAGECDEAEGAAPSRLPTSFALVGRLEVVRGAFTDAWVGLLAVGGGSLTQDWLLQVARTSSGRLKSGDCGSDASWTRAGHEVVQACYGLWESDATALEVKSVALETAHAILTSLGWSAEELCRRNPSMVCSSFFAALCGMVDAEVRKLVQRSLDVLIAPCLLHLSGVEGEKKKSGKRGRRAGSGSDTAEALHSAEPQDHASLDRIALILDDVSLSGVSFAPVVAFVLYRRWQTPTSQKMAWLDQLMQFVGGSVEEAPLYTNNALATVVLQLLSLEADAQLDAHGTRSGAHAEVGGSGGSGEAAGGGDAVDGVAYSIFCTAVQQVVTLSECQGTRGAIEKALDSPVTATVASLALVRSVFDVLDSIYGLMGIRQLQAHMASRSSAAAAAVVGPQRSSAGTASSLSSLVSVTTMHRWLLGLCSFVRFLGTHATLIAAKLPAMLEACATVPALLTPACVVWRELIMQCSDDYLEEHAPAIVVDLVAMELYHTVSSSTIAVLASAMKRLYNKTLQAPFWQSYFKVLGRTSQLIQLLHGEVVSAASQVTPRKPPARRVSRGKRSPGKRGAAAGNEDGATANEQALDASGKAEVVMTGFMSVMQSSSIKCKAVFVRALFEYLAHADPLHRLEMTRAASSTPELIPTLLRCARELQDEEDVQIALRCVGMIGAVAPQPVTQAERPTPPATATGDTAQATAPSPTSSFGLAVASSLASLQSYHLDLEAVLLWRKLAYVLLEVYCPRALANTADAGMHDRAAYAVQELLRVCTKEERRSADRLPLRDDEVLHVEELLRHSWWSQLNPKCRALLEGFSTTKYTTLVVQQSERRTPEYRPGMSYQAWLFAFFRNLASRCQGVFGEMMASLRNVAKRDHALMMFLLPYVVVHLLECGDTRTWEDILCEIDVLFTAATDGVDGADARLSLRSQNPLEGSPKRVAAHNVDEHVQLLLHLLEDIEQLRWRALRIEKQLDRSVLAEQLGKEACERLTVCLKEFLDRIPWNRRALAAIEIGSNMRALRVIESQRRLPRVAEAMQRVPLQRIFAALDDRDSARSIHRFSHGLKPAEAAFSFENNGDWQFALQNCELVLQHEPNSVAHQFTSLRCMRQLGQLHLMSRYAEALLEQARHQPPTSSSSSSSLSAAASPSLSRQASPSAAATREAATAAVAHLSTHAKTQELATLQNYANEAAWRLGEWDKVFADSSLPVSLATPVVEWIRVLDSAQAPIAVVAAAAEQRLKLTPIIRAACREGYAQGYPYVATLHALADIEVATEVLSRAAASATDTASAVFLSTAPVVEGVGGSAGGGASNRVGAEESITIPQKTVIEQLRTILTERMASTDTTLEAREPLLSLHRSIFRAVGMEKEVADAWLQHAQLLRDAGFTEAALSAARQSNYDVAAVNPAYCLLTAELLHDLNTPRQAIEFAQGHFENPNLPTELRAQLQVRITNWMLEIGSQSPKEVIHSYETALELSSSEEAHHHLALFYDRLYHLTSSNVETARQAASPTDRTASANHNAETLQSIEQYAAKAIWHFGKALLHGTTTLSVSLPRLLTLWLDGCDIICGMASGTGSSATGFDNVRREKLLQSLNTMVEGFMLGTARLSSFPMSSSSSSSSSSGSLSGSAAAGSNRSHTVSAATTSVPSIPPRILVTALPQLLSRLGHPSEAVVSIITRIVVHLMRHYPQPCLWNVMPIAFSNQKARAEVVKQSILNPFSQQSSTHRVCLENIYAVFKSLIDLCYCPASNFGSDPRLAKLTKQSFIQRIEQLLPEARILLPTMANLTPNVAFTPSTTPAAPATVQSGTTKKEANAAGENAKDGDEEVFPSSPTFHHFDDRVEVMNSLQKPKRIWVHADTGDTYSFLCKSKDEPRKDIRMMEVASLMNTLFLTDSEARRKQFALRRYCIAALVDDCAIIEWVDDSSPLRHVVTHCYGMDGSGVRISQVKAWQAKVDNKSITKMEMFERHILPAAPPVLHQWFDQTFANNQDWYQARTLFTQSTALWSMAGHIVGLGDRHAENLMIDTKRGELLHVDFACMFDKGETLEVPERVRFRLTQNLVDGMGVLGADGPFRANCEIALRCQVKNKNAVMSVVETLLHDPLVEWTSRSSRGRSVDPTRLIDRVARRLDGFLDLFSVPREKDTMALNVEGQVSKLISHSSALENLSEMYTWWMAWI